MNAIERLALRHGENFEWEYGEVIRLMADVDVRTVVEIGVFEGNSLYVWREAFDPDTLIGIDPDMRVPEEDNAIIRADLIVGSSHEQDTYDRVLELLAGRPIDFLFVDGDHTLPALRQDWTMYEPLVRDGGIVVLHDAVITWNNSVDVYQFIQEPDIAACEPVILWAGGDPRYPYCSSTGAALITVRR